MRRGVTALLVVIVAACSSGGPVSRHKVGPTPEPPTSVSSASTPDRGPPQREEPPLPAAVRESAATAASGVLYVIAGFDSAGRSTPGVFVYDRVRWAVGPRLPTALDHTAAASADDALYVVGGFSSSGASARVFRLADDHWEEMPPLRYPRGALGLVAVGAKLFALGGNDGGSQVAVPEVFDTHARVWQDVSPMPAPRNHVASFAYRGLACVAGGRSPNVARVDCYDPTSRGWQVMPSLPTVTSGAGAAALGDKVVVAGGENTDQNTIVDQVARFQAGNWLTEAMLHPRHGIQLAVLDGRAWACGGAPRPGLGPVNDCTSIG